MTTKRANKLLVLLLISGTLFAWTNVLIEFRRFYELNNSYFKLRDCISTNPILTPCFWGSISFVFSTFWSMHILRLEKPENKLKHIKNLFLLLVGSVIFAWSVFLYEVYQFINSDTGFIQTCSGTVDSPLKSSCLYGAIIFTLSLLVAYKFKKLLGEKINN